MRAYAQAYRLRPQSFGTIAMALTSGSHGRLWLDEAALRRSLGNVAFSSEVDAGSREENASNKKKEPRL
jgi:hypothetical protein